jgi:outer membrane protein TolC
LDIASKNNPAVLQRYYEYQAALQKVPQVGSLPDPEFSLGIFLSPMELLGGNQVADMRLMQMFPWFGVIKSARDEMSLMAAAKFELVRDAKLQLFFDIQRNWYEMHKVKQEIRIAEKNIEILQSLERIAIARFKAAPAASAVAASGSSMSSSASSIPIPASSGMNNMGSSTSAPSNQAAPAMPSAGMGSQPGSSGLTDVYRIQIEVNDLQDNIESLKTQWNSLAASFNAYLNRPAASPVTLPDTLLADALPFSLLAVSDSIRNNPMLGMLKYEQQSLEARKQMVTRMGYPMVGLGVNYSLISKSEMSASSMNGRDMIMPMVTATLPIYRKKYRAMQAEADLLKSANSQNYAATGNALQTEYYQALQLYQDAGRRVKLNTDQQLLASKSLNIMVKSFAASGSGLTDILRLRQQTLDYEYRKTEAIADSNIAIAWLKRLAAFTE